MVSLRSGIDAFVDRWVTCNAILMLDFAMSPEPRSYDVAKTGRTTTSQQDRMLDKSDRFQYLQLKSATFELTLRVSRELKLLQVMSGVYICPIVIFPSLCAMANLWEHRQSTIKPSILYPSYAALGLGFGASSQA